MKNNKGQALVEFVIVVPILIFIIMAIIDFGNITIKKINLENNLESIVALYEKNDLNEINNLAIKENISLSYNTNQDLTTITLRQNVKIFTPFLNIALGTNYSLEVSRVIYEE